MKKHDPDTPLTDKEWQALGPAMQGIEELPDAAKKAVRKSMRGRPPVEHPKEKVTVRLDADLLAELRASGPGWQTRLNDAIRKWLQP